MRKIFEIKNDTLRVAVHYNREWQEYRIRLYLNGEFNDITDVFTDDKEDAIATAKTIFNVSL
jgi:hypothetical protein